MITLTEIYVSTWLLLRSSLMIFTAVLGIIIINKKQYMHHWLGIALVMIGIAIVCVVSEHYREDEDLRQDEGAN